MLVAALAGISTTGRKANPDPNIAIIEKIANIAFEFTFMTCHEPLPDINILSQFDLWSLGLSRCLGIRTAVSVSGFVLLRSTEISDILFV
jgi:hypothetical protein